MKKPKRADLVAWFQTGGVYNDRNLLVRYGTPGRDVWIALSPAHGVAPAFVRVTSPTHATDQGAPWYAFGSKVFYYLSRASKAEAWKAAEAWAAEQYGVTTWTPSPFNPRVAQADPSRFRFASLDEAVEHMASGL